DWSVRRSPGVIQKNMHGPALIQVLGNPRGDLRRIIEVGNDIGVRLAFARGQFGLHPLQGLLSPGHERDSGSKLGEPNRARLTDPLRASADQGPLSAQPIILNSRHSAYSYES